MNKSTKKVLIIVEGASLEPRFFGRLTEVYGTDIDVYIVGTNIYALYQKMKFYRFECDVKDVLPEIGTPVAEKMIFCKTNLHIHI